MALEYKLEYVYDETKPSDSSVYIHLKENPPIYISHTDKEDYDELTDEEKHPFLSGIFDSPGVVEASTRAYRVWVMKSPVFQWEEVLNSVLNHLAESFEQDSLYQLPGSANLNGTGFTVPNPNQRRKI